MENILDKNANIEEMVKKMIVERLGLDISPEEIDDNEPIFGTNSEGKGLGLDSVDGLELVVGLNEAFGVKHQSDDLSIMYSVKTISDYIRQRMG